MWEYNYTPDEDELYHWGTSKFHKYIAKIGEGINAKYFYTQQQLAAYKKNITGSKQYKDAKKKAGIYKQAFKEEAKKSVDYTKKQLNNYGKALSSKDEKEKYLFTTDARKNSIYSPMKTANIRTETAKENYKKNPTYGNGLKAHKFEEAKTDYERAKTLKGKAEDAAKVYKQSNTAKSINKAVNDYKHSETARNINNAKLKVAKGKKYVEKALSDYGKALSSKDEKQAYEKAKERADKASLIKTVTDGNATINYYRTTNKLAKYNVYDKKLDYQRAKTLDGKIEDVVSTYKKRKKKK